jgi:hypothetical protein
MNCLNNENCHYFTFERTGSVGTENLNKCYLHSSDCKPEYGLELDLYVMANRPSYSLKADDSTCEEDKGALIPKLFDGI